MCAHCFFGYLASLDHLLWSYLALSIIIAIGMYFTIRSKFFQITSLFQAKKCIIDLSDPATKNYAGTNPLKLYFASIGGMIGLGNLVVVMSTVTIGGPGSLIWLWMASLLGMLIKYSEIYLGIKYRVKNSENGYDGGPMYYLQAAFNTKSLSILVAVLLCIYGAEVSQFLIITDTIVKTFSVDRYIVIGVLLALVLLSAVGGVKRLATVCSTLMPPFLLGYIGVGIVVIIDHAAMLPDLFVLIGKSAFSGHAPLGGFVGSSMLLAMHQGVSRAVYSGDIGIGYDSIIQSETKILQPEKQARLSILALFSDSLICTISILIVLVTGLWTAEGLQPSDYITVALSAYVPKVEIFMALLFFIAGFTTLVGYLVVGQKCAKFLSPKFGKPIYIIYAIFAFIFFSFHEQEDVMLLMSTSGGLLIIINLLGVLKLRKEVKFI